MSRVIHEKLRTRVANFPGERFPHALCKGPFPLYPSLRSSSSSDGWPSVFSTRLVLSRPSRRLISTRLVHKPLPLKRRFVDPPADQQYNTLDTSTGSSTRLDSTRFDSTPAASPLLIRVPLIRERPAPSPERVLIQFNSIPIPST